ncbi:MAG: BBP7 family outer membrane beta-barrel protein [Gemmatales bacterium]
MKRAQWKWFGLAIAGMGFTSLQAQEGGWKPVTEHRARYESIDGAQSMTLIGKPITGRSKVDQAVQPASFGADQRSAAPLPPAPPLNGTGYETLGYPRSAPMVTYPQGTIPMQTAAASPGIRPVPMNTMPNGTVVYPNGIPNGVVNYPMQDSMPQYNGSPVIVNGQVVNGQPINGQVVNGQVVNGQVIGSPVMGSPGYDMGLFPNACPDGNCFGGMSDRFYMQAIHGSPGIWYGSAEFVLYSLSSDKSPPLVITGPQTTTNINSPGVSVLYGGTLNTDPGFGGKVTMGAWFNRCQTWGMFGSFFTTGTQQQTSTFGSADGSVFVARPFFNNSPINFDGTPHTPAEDIELVSATGLGGTVAINRTSLLRGADLNFRFNWCNYTSCSGRFAWNLDKYFGVKYMSLDESLTVTENLRILPTETGQVTDRFFVRDSFMTRNNFIGGNLGLMSELRLGRFFFDAHGSIALGATEQEVSIAGNTQITHNNVPSPLLTGGLLGQQTNIGSYTRSQFSVIPEIGLKLGWQVTDHFRLFAGMDFTYWSNVVRPASRLTTPSMPASCHDSMPTATPSILHW